MNTKKDSAFPLRYPVRFYLKRYFLLVCALVIMALGVALSIIANMGISPISCLPYALSEINPVLTVGQYTAAMHIVFVLLQIILLRGRYQVYQLLQLVVGVILGTMIDLFLALFSFIEPANYLQQCLVFLISTGVVGFGMFLEVKAGVLMVAGEGLVMALAIVTRREFSRIKIISDCSLVALTVLLGIIFLHNIVGVREGTVLAALLVGMSIKYFNTHIHLLDRFLGIPEASVGKSPDMA